MLGRRRAEVYKALFTLRTNSLEGHGGAKAKEMNKISMLSVYSIRRRGFEQPCFPLPQASRCSPPPPFFQECNVKRRDDFERRIAPRISFYTFYARARACTPYLLDFDALFGGP